MAQISLQNLTTEWVAFSSITAVDANATYYIQNRGADYLVACEGSSEPITQEGVFVPPSKILKYKKGNQNLYLRASTKGCSINISNEG